MKSEKRLKAWVVSADMGYGHQRAVSPFKQIAEERIINVGKAEATSPAEKKLWRKVLAIYELLSRARSVPIVGKRLFKALDFFLQIPSFYPKRNLSESTFQVHMMETSIKKGLCSGMLEKIRTKDIPLLTSFFAPAIAADMDSFQKIYCIICDADLNRVWVAKDPWESRIKYFAPCGNAAIRLKLYGVPEDRIFLTGFPLPEKNIGGLDMPTLKNDLGQRLHYLDPNKRFWPLHSRNVIHFLGEENCEFKGERKLTLSYAVGGAGAQKEIGEKILRSLKRKILNDEIRINLIAGSKKDVRDYFEKVKRDILGETDSAQIIYAEKIGDYFEQFNNALRTTDILWTKPSELSFFCGLGIPIIMAPAIGSQEKFNRRWLREKHTGIKQMKPEYADQWIFDLLNRGVFAEMAWSGFLKTRKLGAYKIKEILATGRMTENDSPALR